ncbi:MAG TPA: glycine oxidase ThiO [Candidatus Baltobacteraceae bacterium]|jgi:glycine oxidase|nr:glycine oxidase ThiO [Candidatus Baltobacteraceae bacterium]
MTEQPTESRDVEIIVIGAGLIGLSIARELAVRGHAVRVLEMHQPITAASWAGAGMLAPYTEALTSPELEALCLRSLETYPAFVAELREQTGVDAHLRLDGILQVAYDVERVKHLQERVSDLACRGVSAHWLDRSQARELEPALGPALVGAAFIEGEGQVDNRRLARALYAACLAHGVRIETEVGNVALDADERRVRGVRTSSGYVAARFVVNATGAWAGGLGGVPERARVPVHPVKGQILALALPRALMRRVLWVPGAYLVPRSDGRLLIGATVEDAGFDVRVTARGVRSLLDAALYALPALADLALVETWAGLRPGTADGLPILGTTPLDGYLVASGHYRNGILLTPITARVVSDLIEGVPPEIDLRAFRPERGLLEAVG